MHSADILPTRTHFALETQSDYLGGKTPFSQMALSLLLLNSPQYMFYHFETKTARSKSILQTTIFFKIDRTTIAIFIRMVPPRLLVLVAIWSIRFASEMNQL